VILSGPRGALQSTRHAASGIPHTAGVRRANDRAPPRGDCGRGGTLAAVLVRVDGLNSAASIHASVFDHRCSAAHAPQWKLATKSRIRSKLAGSSSTPSEILRPVAGQQTIRVPMRSLLSLPSSGACSCSFSWRRTGAPGSKSGAGCRRNMRAMVRSPCRPCRPRGRPASLGSASSAARQPSPRW
jgi:hypothetical protein